MPEKATFYISIGNNDDKLPQVDWGKFCSDLGDLPQMLLTRPLGNPLGELTPQRIVDVRVHGYWYSAPDSIYQNACMCIEVSYIRRDYKVDILELLSRLADKYHQDSIMLAEAQTEFVHAMADVRCGR